MNEKFWEALDKLIASSRIVIDRPKGSEHPRFHGFFYPVDYGYLENTSSMDGSGIDLYMGTREDKALSSVIVIVDLFKRDSEIKLLIGCTESETRAIYKTHNETEFMKGLLINR